MASAAVISSQNDESPGKPKHEPDVPMEVAHQPTLGTDTTSGDLKDPASPITPDNNGNSNQPDSTSRSPSPADSGISSLTTVQGIVITESMLAEEQNLKEQGTKEEKKIQREALDVWEKEQEEQRYKRLQHLLEKSGIYSNFLLAKMDEQQATQKKRQAKMKKKQDLKVAEKKMENKEVVKMDEKKMGKKEEKVSKETTPVTPRRISRRKKQDPESSSQESDSQRQMTPSRSTRSGAAPKSEPKDKSPHAAKKGRPNKRKVAETYSIADYVDRGLLAKKQKSDKSNSQDEATNNSASLSTPSSQDSSKTEGAVTNDPKSSSSNKDLETSASEDLQDPSTTHSDDDKNIPNSSTSDPEKFVDTFSRTVNSEKISDRQPDMFSGGRLRDYQIEGMEWLKVLYENGVNGILGDEMGLGKTVQCIALFAHIIKMGVPGPFLVCAPLSTLPNWMSEFQRFTPTIPVILYHGHPTEREKMRRKIYKKHGDFKTQPVVITSYEIVMRDRKELQHHLWKYIIIDEGHRIKNLNCRLIRELKCYKSANRLLLTGTPLQNNLAELWSMLNFLLPEVFDDLRTFESWFDFGTLSKEGGDEAIVAKEREKHVVSMLHQILTPFLLRRLKTDVDLKIPPKKEILLHAPLTKLQAEYYKTTVDRTILGKIKEKKEKDEPVVPVELTPSGRIKRRSAVKVDYAAMMNADPDNETQEEMEKWMARLEKAVETPTKAKKGPKNAEFNIKMINIMMQLRKVCNHPYLLEYPLIPETQEYRIDEELINSCGKFLVLDRLLPQLKQRGHKVLLFSQMTTMLDIIEDYCLYRKHQYCRLDGRMQFADRQEQINEYNTDKDKFIFLLSTRAGGLGINLTSADTVIIYDSDWNPQSDLQAQDRCHRIGQVKPVIIYRLVTANTIDQEIVDRASAKRRLEKMVIHQGKFKGGQQNILKDSKSLMNPKELLELLRSKDHSGEVKNSGDEVISDSDLELLLDRSDLMAKHKAKLAGKEAEVKSAKAGKGVVNKMAPTSGVFKVIDDEQEDGGSTDLRILT